MRGQVPNTLPLAIIKNVKLDTIFKNHIIPDSIDHSYLLSFFTERGAESAFAYLKCFSILHLLHARGFGNGQRNKAIGRDVNHGFFARLVTLFLQSLDVKPSQIGFTAAKFLLQSCDCFGAALSFGDFGAGLQLGGFLPGLGLQHAHLTGALGLHEGSLAGQGAVVDPELRQAPKDEGQSRDGAKRDENSCGAIHD